MNQSAHQRKEVGLQLMLVEALGVCLCIDADELGDDLDVGVGISVCILVVGGAGVAGRNDNEVRNGVQHASDLKRECR